MMTRSAGALVSFFLASACSGEAPGAFVDGGPQVSTTDASVDAPAIEAATHQACTPLAPRVVPIDVAVLPEAGEAPYLSVIASAKTSIRVMVYEMGYGGILTNLQDKAKAGVSVRVVLDVAQKDTNKKYFDLLTEAGASVIWSDSKFTYMHAKVLIVDDAVAVISTGNYSKAYMLKERNFVATDRDVDDVGNLARLFDADWKRESPDLSCTRLVVAPVNARTRLLDFLRAAKSEILIESMQFSDEDVRDVVLERKKAGVTVRAILADPDWIDANAKAAAPLKNAGIDVRWLKTPGVHVKAVVVDHQRAYLGSENFSRTSLSKNREIGLLVDEVKNIDLMAATFEKDWAEATKF